MRRAFGFFSSILLAPEGDPSGGGGAGGSGDGSGNPGGGEQPAGLTEAKVNELINKALSPRFRDFETKQTKLLEGLTTKLTETFTSSLSSLDEKLKDLKPEPPAGGKKDPPADITQTAEFKKLQRQLEEQGQKLQAAETERNKERDAKRASDFNRSVEAELTKLGVQDPEGARILLQARGRVKFRAEDDDTIVYAPDKDSEDDLNAGLTGWTKSAEGKRFMPPSGANGSGDRLNGGKKPVNGSTVQPTTDEIGQALARELGLPLS
jgi:hypothetical protein